MCFTVRQRTSREAPTVRIAGLFSGAVGFLHKRELHPLLLPELGYNEPRCKYSGAQLGMGWGVITWDAVFQATPVQFRPPSDPLLFLSAGTMITKFGTTLVQILQRLKPWNPLRGEVPDCMGSKCPITKTFSPSSCFCTLLSPTS